MDEVINDYNSLLNIYIDLIRMREDVVFKKQPYLEAKYALIFSDLMKEELLLVIHIKKLKKKIQIEVSDFRSIKDVDDELICKNEIEILKEQVEYLDEIVNLSENNLEIRELSIEEKEELKELFRDIIKRLHPDLVVKHSENKCKLWEKARDAYCTNNLQIMRIMWETIGKKEHYKVKIYTKEELEKKTWEIYEEIKQSKRGFPFSIERNIEDPLWVEESRQEIKDRIKNLKEEENYLINILNNLC